MAKLEDVSYTIVHVNTDTVTIFVRYKTPDLPSGLVFPIDLPIGDDNSIPVGAALDELIKHNIPLEQLTMAEVDYAWGQARLAKAPFVDFTSIPVVLDDTPVDQPISHGAQTI